MASTPVLKQLSGGPAWPTLKNILGASARSNVAWTTVLQVDVVYIQLSCLDLGPQAI